MSERNAVPGFGARLKALRIGENLSQQALADAAGTHADSIVKLENGSRYPSLELACRIADALGVTVLHLLPTGAPWWGQRKKKNSAGGA